MNTERPEYRVSLRCKIKGGREYSRAIFNIQDQIWILALTGAGQVCISPITGTDMAPMGVAQVKFIDFHANAPRSANIRGHLNLHDTCVVIYGDDAGKV